MRKVQDDAWGLPTLTFSYTFSYTSLLALAIIVVLLSQGSSLRLFRHLSPTWQVSQNNLVPKIRNSISLDKPVRIKSWFQANLGSTSAIK